MIKITSTELAELAMEAETQNPIDWGMLAIKEEQAFLMMANNVIEQIQDVPDDQRLYVCMATMTKMLVENFCLNLQLKGAENVKNNI